MTISADPPAGLVVIESAFGAKETMERLAGAVMRLGMSVAARVDHAQAAASAGLSLRPTEVLIFGNPKVGTALMQAAQTIGIDLPLKALAWEDKQGKSWLGYNDPTWLARRHGIAAAAEQSIALMTKALATAAEQAAGRSAKDSTSTR